MDENKKKEIAKKIGNRIYELRKSKKLSREKFAEICNVSSQHIYYIEKGEFLPRMYYFDRYLQQFFNYSFSIVN